MKERLLAAFWHKGRKAFVPWMPLELANRIKRPPELVEIELRGLAGSGLARSQNIAGARGQTTWELTTAGKIEARAIIAAQDIVRSA